MIRMARQVMKESWSAIGKSGSDNPASWMELTSISGTATKAWEHNANRLPSLKISPQASTTNQDAILRYTQDMTLSNFLGARIRFYGVECSVASSIVQMGFAATTWATDRGAFYYDVGANAPVAGFNTLILSANNTGTDTYRECRYGVNTPAGADAVYATPKDIALSIYREKPNGSATFKQYVRFEVDEQVIYEREHDTSAMILSMAVRPGIRVANQSSTQGHLWIAGGDLTIWC